VADKGCYWDGVNRLGVSREVYVRSKAAKEGKGKTATSAPAPMKEKKGTSGEVGPSRRKLPDRRARGK
jgi:hypothetical protein